MSTVRIQVRRGLAADWASVDPTLAGGEIGLESDTGKFKIGNDVDAWQDLPYANVTPAGLGNALGDYLPTSARGTANGVASLDSTGKILDSELPDTISLIGDLTVAGDLTVQGTSVSLNVENILVEDNEIILNSNVTTGSPTIDGRIVVSRGSSNPAIIYWKESDDTWRINDGTSDSTIAKRETTEAYVVDTVETYLESYVNNSTINQANGVAGLDEGPYVLNTLISPEIARVSDVAADISNAITDALTTADGYVSTHNSDTTNVHGITDTAALATKTYADDAVSTHNADTTSVHGIADTSALATLTNVSNAQTTAEGYADSAVSTHNADTTSVHGIADTSKLVATNSASTTLDGDLVVDGSLTINGTTTTVSTANFQTTDPLIYLGEDNQANTVDLGFVASFNDGTYQHTGLVKDTSDSKWKLFKGVTDEPTTVVNFAQGSLDDLALHNITAAGVIFTDGTQTKQGVPSITPIVQKTTSYNIDSLSLRDSLIEMSSTSSVAVNIPTDAAYNFPIGTTLDILQTNTGQVTIQGDDGVTVNATPGLKLRTQWSSATLFKRAANTWVVYGDLMA